VELLEFYTIARALDLDPVDLFRQAAERFDGLRATPFVPLTPPQPERLSA
jgi:hypothetical protein